MKTVEELETVLNYQESFLKNVRTVLEKTRKELEELKKNKSSFEPTPKGWKPKDGEDYHFASLRLEVCSNTFDDSIFIDEQTEFGFSQNEFVKYLDYFELEVIEDE